MGCVQSSQTRRSARAKQARRQKLYEQQNFHPKVSKTTSSSTPVKVKEEVAAQTPRESRSPVKALNTATTPASPLSPSSGNSSTPNNAGNSNNEEIQFRRQHFDRNSMLRHSKKRRKSSASASPNVTANNKSLLQQQTSTAAVGLSPSRLKFEQECPPDGGRKKGFSHTTSSPLASSTGGGRTTKNTNPSSFSAKPPPASNSVAPTAAHHTPSKMGEESNKVRIPKSSSSTSPETQLQRQNSGRLI